jgi:hypothetical protein
MPDNGKDRTRFAEYVKLQAVDRGFLSRNEEKELLQDGMARFNVDYDEARWILTGVAAEEQVALERELDRMIAVVLARFADTNDKITKDEFDDAVHIYKNLSKDGLTENAIKKKMKTIVSDNKWRPARKGMLRSKRWYRRIDKL